MLFVVFSLFFVFCFLLNSSRIVLRFWTIAVRRVYRSLRNFGSNWIRFQQSSTWLGHLSGSASATKRERKSMRAQESVRGYEKNQLLFTTLQAASGNSADTGGMCTHLPRERESEWAEESAQASQLNNSCRERERELTTAWERMPLLSSAYRLHNSISFYLSTYSGNQNTKRTTKKETESGKRAWVMWVKQS